MAEFAHRRMPVFVAATDLIVVVDRIVGQTSSRHWYLRDQLYRAVVSILLNIAEGAGEYSPKDKARFYRIARRSAAEADGALAAFERLGIGHTEDLEEARRSLQTIGAMLTGLIRKTLSRIPPR